MVQKGKLDALAEANSSSENFVQVDIPHREAFGLVDFHHKDLTGLDFQQSRRNP